MFQSLMCGSAAGGVAGLLTNPIDVVKTNLMTDSKGYFNNSLDCLRFLLKEDGLSSLLRGSFFRTLQMSIMSGLLFCGYETVLNHSIDHYLHLY